MIKIEVDSKKDNERNGYMCSRLINCDVRGLDKGVAEFKAVLKGLEECNRMLFTLAIMEMIGEDEDD